MKRPVAIGVGMAMLALGSLGLGYYANVDQVSRPSTTKGGDAIYAATLEAIREPSLRRRGALLAASFASATGPEVDAITRALEQTDSGLGLRAMARELLAELWSRHDPAGGLERVSAWRPVRMRRFVPALMNAWARRDGSAARAHLATLEGDKLRAQAERSTALGLFAARGEKAFEQYWAEWPFGQAVLRDVLAETALRDGFEALVERVEQLPDSAPSDFRAQAIRAVAALGGRIDPERTALFVAAHADDSLEELRNLLAPFVDAWCQVDPRAALEWVMTRPSGHRRSSALRVGYRSWALDPATAADAVAWIEAQPAEVQRPVQDFYALALMRSDPDRAIAAAEQIDAPNRDAILERVRRNVDIQSRMAADSAGAARVEEPSAELPDAAASESGTPDTPDTPDSSPSRGLAPEPDVPGPERG